VFRLSRERGIDPEQIRTFDICKREKEMNHWPLSKRLIFVNDMTDTFGEFYSFDLIEKWHQFFERHPEREFQLLTKRIGRAMVFYRSRPVPRNVWVGCSIGEKKRLWRLDQLRQIDAKIRFVSFEPLIKDLGDFDLKGVQWAIVGGESDRNNPRPMKPEWAESIRKVCERDGVAFFFKQVGGRGGDNAGGDQLNGLRYQACPQTDNCRANLLASPTTKRLDDEGCKAPVRSDQSSGARSRQDSTRDKHVLATKANITCVGWPVLWQDKTTPAS
jgi:protein gp37